MTNQTREALIVDKNKIKESASKQMARVLESINWPSGPTIEQRIYQIIWQKSPWRVLLGKPGKEAFKESGLRRYKDGHLDVNPNDMHPRIQMHEQVVTKNATFTDVFEELQKIGRSDEQALELIACLLFRSSYMLDHADVGGGKWRYTPPQAVINEIAARVPCAYGVPIEVFLHYLDALAWNEDTKYHTLGYEIGKGVGRQNNLLTCVHIIAVFLGRVSLVKFAGNFARPPVGLSAISRKKAYEVFPYLGGS